MSVFSSLNTSVNGVIAQSTRIGIISENLANSTTTGYRRVDATFANIVSGKNDLSQSAFSPGGVGVSSRLTFGREGVIRGTSNNLDLAISGSGFFTVNTEATNTENLRYTRAGNFTQNQNGDFINENGFFLKGWRLEEDGALPDTLNLDQVPSATALAALETINVNAITINPIPTANVSIQANLQASQPIFADPYDAAGGVSIAAGTVNPHFLSQFQVIDSLGGEHQFNFGFVKTAINTWEVEIYALDNTAVNAPDGLIASGQIIFNGDGTPATIATSLTDPITIDWASDADDNIITFALGTAGQPFGTPGATVIGRQDGIFQLDTDYFVNDQQQDGQTAGSLESINVDDEGYVYGLYSNQATRRVFKIPLANFIDPSQLVAETGNIFATTNQTSLPAFQALNQSSFASIITGALEDSNVDIAQELVDLIVAQRAYESNTDVIQTSDELLQRLDQMLG